MSLPLLLGPVGSLALPSVPEPCASVNAVARRSDNLQDIFERLLRSAQNNAEHIAAPSQPNIGTTPFEMTPQNVSGREDLAEQGEAPDDTSGKKVDKGKQNSTDSDGEKKSQDEKKDKEEENDEDDDDEGGDDGVEEENGDEEDSDEEEHSDQEEDEDEDEEEEEDGDEDDSGIPLDPNRKNQAGGASAKEKKHTMYHLVMPNPNRYAGHQDIGSDERYYYRKIIDDEENLRGYRRDNPSFAAAKSHGQEERITAGPDADRRPGPAKVEAKATTGHADGDGTYPVTIPLTRSQN